MRFFLPVLLLCSILSIPIAHAAPEHVVAERKIIDLGHNIYRFQNNSHYSIFIIGKEGVLLTDPINKDAATWLKAEIKKRFGDLPIKYVVYSHNHGDHVFGGEVFDEEGTVFIAQELAKEDLERNNAPTKIPNITFTDHMTLDFEGRQIELQHYGRNNGVGSISLYVPDAKFLFVVDWIVIKRLPWREMYYYDLDGAIASIKEVLKLDFDLVSPGHSVTGTKDEVRHFLKYLETLRSEVLASLNEGKSLAQMQEEIALDEFSDYAHFDEWRKMNIKGAYDQLLRISGRHGQDK